MKWSILIASVPSRLRMMARLYDELMRQIKEYDDIEILVLVDNKMRSIGKKRNSLLGMASGEYMSFIDDDDTIAPNYVNSIYPKLQDVDVITFSQLVTDAYGPEVLCTYSLRNEYAEGPGWWCGLPAHTMVWRTDIARRGVFPDNNVEDYDWVQQVCNTNPDTETVIRDTLYFYRRNRRTTEIKEHKII